MLHVFKMVTHEICIHMCNYLHCSNIIVCLGPRAPENWMRLAVSNRNPPRWRPTFGSSRWGTDRNRNLMLQCEEQKIVKRHPMRVPTSAKWGTSWLIYGCFNISICACIFWRAQAEDGNFPKPDKRCSHRAMRTDQANHFPRHCGHIRAIPGFVLDFAFFKHANCISTCRKNIIS